MGPGTCNTEGHGENYIDIIAIYNHICHPEQREGSLTLKQYPDIPVSRISYLASAHARAHYSTDAKALGD